MPWSDKEGADATDAAIKDPRAGDRFHEMYAFWIYVVHVEGDTVVTMEASPPCEFPKDGNVVVQTREEFKLRLSYGVIPGYWVRLADRGNNVAGWWRPKKRSKCTSRSVTTRSGSSLMARAFTRMSTTAKAMKSWVSRK